MKTEKKILDLGWMNGWDYTPDKGEANRQLLRQCSKLGHRVVERSGFGRCVTTCACAECGYIFKVDSSD